VSIRASLPDRVKLDFADKTIQLGTTEPNDIQPVLDVLRANGAVIRRVMPVRPSLEDLFMEAVRERFQSAAPGAAIPVGAQPLAGGASR
jgi:hypothetical protein